MKRLPCFILVFVAILFVAAEKKQSKPKPSAAQIQQWIKQLGNDDFKVREKATRDLIKAGGVAFDAVTKATKSKDAEVKQRALKIIKQIGKHLEKTAIAYFKNLRGTVTVDKENPGKPVTELFLKYTNITDAGLVHLKGLAKLQRLDFRGTKITDAGLVHLKGLSSLEYLNLSGTKLTDAGLVHLKGLTSLEYLNLNQTKVTDTGLVHLKGLTKLQELVLWHTDVTDAGLVHLKGLTGLRVLWLIHTKVTRAEIEKLQKALPKCKIGWDGK